ncbi:hypothetical protein FVE85_8891 [Porphyridium purpureum]|uniref:Uncharacterized protein n=1 Tax=Porphyridium purpureum TaxID=35688 RepID=A0A5J4YQ91_PORPP|nr:hypothetical protein FVE85_8891 [Porphyridium purpureum]|eukprot:POR9091..scf296_7
MLYPFCCTHFAVPYRCTHVTVPIVLYHIAVPLAWRFQRGAQVSYADAPVL